MNKNKNEDIQQFFITLEGTDIQGVPHTFFFPTPYQFTAAVALDVYKRQPLDWQGQALSTRFFLYQGCTRYKYPPAPLTSGLPRSQDQRGSRW